MALSAFELANLNRSLSAKLSNEARKRGVTADVIRKQYIFTLFLCRLFDADPQPPWMLLGGNALLIRTGGGRFTRDIDLARDSAWGSPEEVREELQELVDVGDRDPFVFEVVSVTPHAEPDLYGYGGKTAKAKVVTRLGTEQFESFTVDLTLRRHMDTPVDRVPLRAVIDHVTLEELPTVPTAPLENHLADKVCAMYEPHGDQASTRYRDLADIVRILSAGPIDASRLQEVLGREAARRKMSLPDAMRAPSEEWKTAFPTQARTFAEYPSELYSLDASLDATRPCLDVVLSGERTSGTWNNQTRSWAD